MGGFFNWFTYEVETWHILINLGYVLMFIGLAVRDILWLRSILISAQFFLIGYAIATHNQFVAGWNCLFVSLNIVWVIRILKERRPIKIPDHIKDIYENTFHVMTPHEFLSFWNLGNHVSKINESIIKDSAFLKDISFILSGNVAVVKDKVQVAELTRGRFIGEMSFLSGKPASADVNAIDQVDYICWDQEKLHHLEQLDPRLLSKFHGILGRELAAKIRETSDRVAHHH